MKMFTLFNKETGEISQTFHGPKGTERMQASALGLGLIEGDYRQDLYWVDPETLVPKKKKSPPIRIDVEPGLVTLRDVPLPAKLLVPGFVPTTDLTEDTVTFEVDASGPLHVMLLLPPRYLLFDKEIDVP